MSCIRNLYHTRSYNLQIHRARLRLVFPSRIIHSWTMLSGDELEINFPSSSLQMQVAVFSKHHRSTTSNSNPTTDQQSRNTSSCSEC